MEFKKCSRCGNFYVSNGLVCPKCTPKDDFEFSTFKSYIAENGLNDSVYSISGKTGISVKNLNRYIEYNNQLNGNGSLGGTPIFNGEAGTPDIAPDNVSNLKTNNKGNNGITFLI